MKGSDCTSILRSRVDNLSAHPGLLLSPANRPGIARRCSSRGVDSQNLRCAAASASLTAVPEVSICIQDTRWSPRGHPGSACFSGSAGTATFSEQPDGAGSAMLGPLPPITDVPGRLRYGYRVWQARRQRRNSLIADLKGRVQSAGLAGVAAMVILNSLYYSGAFLLLWTVVLRPPRGLGAAGAAQRIGQTLGIAYVASISSKVPRAAAMLLLAPGLNRVMLSAQRALRLKTQGQVFALLLAACLGVFFSTLGAVLVLWI